MNRMLTLITSLLFALGLSISAFSATKSTTVEITQPTNVSGTTLKPGEYKVGVKNPNQLAAGQTAEVSFKRDGKEVAKATGQVKELSRAPQATEVTIDTAGGTPTIAEIDFGGSTTAVTFSPQTVQAGQ